MRLTDSQHEAVVARGNVLVVAGAGTGKTHTLVERCLDCLLNEKPPVSIDEILMVTFTEAAAAEMRKRIRERLMAESQRNGSDSRWKEQLALFETAHFGTLHSFCFQLVRQHFYQLALDPQLAVLPEEQARPLAEETLDALFRGHYSSREPASQAVRKLIQVQARGWDRPIRSMVLRLHHFTQTLPDPSAWLDAQVRLFGQPEPALWQSWYRQAIDGLVREWCPRLEALASSNGVASQAAKVLRKLSGATPGDFSSLFAQIAGARSNYPRGKKTAWIDPLEDFFAESDFLCSLCANPAHSDPLLEDWNWVREHMTTLLHLCSEFGRSFTAAKRELGVVDFHDLEQYALQLLWDPSAAQPTSLARHWRKQFRFIFVDEYQDINAAQDQIIQALAREDQQANRFLVGDVKQSIYRFRLANPRIFQRYADEWTIGSNRSLPLVDNFRSRESLLNFVNSVFDLLMTRDLGGVDYSQGAALRFGAPEERKWLGSSADPEPAVELHLLLQGSGDNLGESEEPSGLLAEIMELQAADREARMVALRLRELRAQQIPVWDFQLQQSRPVDWRDMAILLRSPAKKAESYAKEFSRLNLPLEVARGGFYQSLEVSDLLSLLQLLDNPLQDIPLLAVLHSPLVGLSANELAEVRLAGLKVRFWVALTRWHRSDAGETKPAVGSATDAASGTARQKVGLFLQRFARWRRLARQASLSRCLETVLAETHYGAWVQTQPRGLQRRANLDRLITLAQEFDRFQRQGLFRFLKFIEAQKAVDAEPEVAESATQNAVRLMSIHQSKGLEFPVVVLADTGKSFNLSDLRSEVILDDMYGLCPRVKPPHTGKRYPSLPYWLARKKQLRESLGEELRLLYVAMTRARDRLLLTGVVGERKFNELWRQSGELTSDNLLAARSFSHWLGLWFSRNAQIPDEELSGQTSLIKWSVHHTSDLMGHLPQSVETDPQHASRIDFESPAWRSVKHRLSWHNPFLAATQLPAKTNVSALRRQAVESQDEDAVPFFPRNQRSSREGSGFSSSSPLSAAEIGNAHHRFLQLLSLNQTESADSLAQQARRLHQQGLLTEEQVKVLDLTGLAHFWNSELGFRIRAREKRVQRELAFTARFAPAELKGMLPCDVESQGGNEFILVQGVADLVVLTSEEIWLVDFKTDQFEPDELAARTDMYAPQLKLYSSALARIYNRPVTEAWLYFLSLRRAVPVIESADS